MRVECSIESFGMSYPKACKIIDELNAAGIDANITAGGVSVYVEDAQQNAAATIVESHGAVLQFGAPAHQRRIAEKYEAMKRAQG